MTTTGELQNNISRPEKTAYEVKRFTNSFRSAGGQISISRRNNEGYFALDRDRLNPKGTWSNLFTFNNTLESLEGNTLSGTATYATDSNDTYAIYSGGQIDVGFTGTFGIGIRFYYSGSTIILLQIGDDEAGAYGIELRATSLNRLYLNVYQGGSSTFYISTSLTSGWNDVFVNINGTTSVEVYTGNNSTPEITSGSLVLLGDGVLTLGEMSIKHFIVNNETLDSGARIVIADGVFEDYLTMIDNKSNLPVDLTYIFPINNIDIDTFTIDTKWEEELKETEVFPMSFPISLS